MEGASSPGIWAIRPSVGPDGLLGGAVQDASAGRFPYQDVFPRVRSTGCRVVFGRYRGHMARP